MTFSNFQGLVVAKLFFLDIKQRFGFPSAGCLSPWKATVKRPWTAKSVPEEGNPNLWTTELD